MRSGARWRRGASLAVALLGAACTDGASTAGGDGAESGAAPEVIVSDSAGIAIVHYQSLGGTESWPEWSVRMADTVRIGRLGRDAADSAYIFGAPVQAVQVFGGSVAVADWQDSSVRIFDEQGNLVRRLGGRGDGPGEFRSVSGVIPLGDDSIAVPEWNARLTVFGADAEVIRAERLDVVRDVTFPRMLHRFSDGSLLLRESMESETVVEEIPGAAVSIYLTEGVERYLRADPTGEVLAVFGVFPRTANVQVPTETFPPMRLFDVFPGPIAEGVGEQFYWGSPNLGEVRVFHESGRLDRLLRFSDSIVGDGVPPVSNRLNRPDSTISEEVRRIITEQRTRTGAGPFSSMVVDDLGLIWLREQTSVDDDTSEWATWYVFDSTGDPAAAARFPYWWGIGGWGVEIHEDVVIAREVDPLDRETYVRVPLVRGVGRGAGR